MEVGQKIRAVRDAKGMTAREVVAITGMGAPSYSRIETGANEPNIDSLKKIAAALGVKPGDLLDDDFQPDVLPELDMSMRARMKQIESLEEEEQKIVFALVDALAGKKKLKEDIGRMLANANKLISG
jgi:transcriptional regulator with XRE-family HTH domain